MTDGKSGDEWWRTSAPPPPPSTPPRIPRPRTDPPPAAAAADADGGGDPGAGAGPGAHGGDGAPPWQDGDGYGPPGVQDVFSAAHEVGAHIGETIAARLPDPYAAAAKRGLDLRWLLLKYNIPGILIALLVTWRGHSGVSRMIRSIRSDGLFAPLGVVVFFGLLLLVLMMLPVGAMLGEALSHLVTSVVRGLVQLVRRAWATPYIGYVLRVLVAALVWSFVLAAAFLGGRAFIHFLTGA